MPWKYYSFRKHQEFLEIFRIQAGKHQDPEVIVTVSEKTSRERVFSFQKFEGDQKTAACTGYEVKFQFNPSQREFCYKETTKITDKLKLLSSLSRFFLEEVLDLSTECIVWHIGKTYLPFR